MSRVLTGHAMSGANERNTHFFDLPLPLGGGDAVSAVVRFLHAHAADADVVSATEELQASLVDGAQRQRKGRGARPAQSVPDHNDHRLASAETR